MKDLLKTFVAAIPDATLVINLAGEVLLSNKAANRLLRYPDDGLVGISVEKLVPVRYREAHKGKRESFTMVGAMRKMGEMKYIPALCFDGEEVMTQISIGNLSSEGADSSYLMVTLLDRTEQVENELELQRLAHTDSLTGLCNRRHFIELANNEISRSIRHRRPLAIVSFDLDHFKMINDTHGHSVGDDFLKQIGILCRKDLRDIDVVGRLGGEEFAALLPDTNAVKAQLVSERLRQSIAKTVSLNNSGKPVSTTASFGVAVFNELGQEWPPGDLAKLLIIADEALYQAKAAGRNQIVLAAQRT